MDVTLFLPQIQELCNTILQKRKPAEKASSQQTLQSDDEDIPVELWESYLGTIAGQVVCWDPDHEFNLPTKAELVDVEAKLAISAAAVATKEAENGTFRYVKTLTESFFSVGVVDLPPVSEKRRKNSRKMYMTFFVHIGCVRVTVNKTSFHISEGGMWFVPRGTFLFCLVVYAVY